MAEQMMQDKVSEMAATQTVPTGYKQTEVGVIPEDWECKHIGELADVVRGGSPRPAGDARFFNGNFIPWLTVASLTNISPEQINVVDTATKLTELGSLRSRVLNEDTLIVSNSGATLGVAKILKIKCCANDGVAALVNQRLGNKVFLAHYINTQTKKLQEQIATGNGQPNLNTDLIRVIPVPFPREAEQAAIANVLSDTDALIASLEQLIAKKQAIKTATMQQLLTGRTRLPQFALRPDGPPKGYKTSALGQIPKDWNVVGFGELFESNVQRQALHKDDLVSFVGMQDVSENGLLISQNKLPFNKVKTGLTYFEKGDVLVAKITPCFENGKGCHTDKLLTEIGYGSTEFHILRAKICADSKFIYYWTTQNSLRIALEAEMVGSAGHRRVPFSALQAYLIPCPTDKDEQSAIATILSDMDSELNALEQKLAKARDVKQGMMQQLLTGRIRLPLTQETTHQEPTPHGL